MQLARVAQEAEAEEERREWRRAAFIGWQMHVSQPAPPFAKVRKIPLKQWMRMMGLAEEEKPAPLSEEEREEIRRQAKAAEAKVIDMFRRGSLKRAK